MKMPAVPRWASVCCLLIVSALSAHAGSPAIRHSDVVFMYDNPEMYEPYGCTVMGWAGGGNRRRIARAHAQGVRQYAVSVGFLTEFKGMIDFSEDFLDAAARDFSGKPFIVPWLWDHKHRGQPAWWWCTNSPLYRDYLESRLGERMPAGPDGLHIDDYRGSSGSVTWLAGCFCRHCMAAFRQYLGVHVSPKRLEELGITELSSFDYRQFLIDRGVTAEQYGKQRASLPLADAFYDFHVKANSQYVARYHKRAEEICGRSLSLCVNSGLSNPQALAIAPQLTYFCCEVPHGAANLTSATHPIYIYKLGEGLDRPITSTASGQDWAYVYDQNRPCLVRTWIALSYAFGHNFMAPHRQWCYTREKGTHWYPGPTEEYAYVYQFVRKNASLLDNYDSVATVAVVYDNAANRRHRGKIEDICLFLASRNIPFQVIVAGDDWLDYRLTPEQVEPLRAVIITKDELEVDSSQRQILDSVAAQDRLITWPNEGKLSRLVAAPVAVIGSDHIMTVPRVNPNDVHAPAVVHLLNRHYAGDRDQVIPQENFTIQVRRDLFHGRSFSKATLHRPRHASTPLALRPNGPLLEVDVPRLGFWGLLELR